MKHMDSTAFVNAVPLKPQKMTLRGLANLLRNQDQWPEGFHWDYTDGRCCAMGLVFAADPSANTCHSYGVSMAKYFNMPIENVHRIFYRAHHSRWGRWGWVGKMENVKPERVAKLIDRYLAKSA